MIVCRCLYLQTGHPRGQHQPHVVSVDHGENPNGSGGDAPGVLEGKLLLSRLLWVLKNNLKHLGEILPQMVGSGSLRTTEHQNEH